MALSQRPVQVHEMNHLDRTLDNILSKLDEKEPIKQSDINQIIVAAVTSQ